MDRLMDHLQDKSFDFSIRIMEMAKYLEEEKKPFPLIDRLLACAAGIGINLRLAALDGRRAADSFGQALSCAVEAEYLLEAMVKTSCLTEKQSTTVINDCREIKTLIAGYFTKN